MEGLLIFVLIMIVSSLLSKKSRPNRQNGRTGTFASPVGGKKPGRVMRDEANPKPIEPVVQHPQPIIGSAKPIQTAVPPQNPPEKTMLPLPEKGHSAVRPGQLAQGDSRECEHGAVGGSMEVRQHEGSPKPIARPVSPRGQNTSASNDLVREMQRAVIMAEILKRPSPGARRYAGR